MSKMASRPPTKSDGKGNNDHRRDLSGCRNDRSDKSYGYSRSVSSTKNKDERTNTIENSKDARDKETPLKNDERENDSNKNDTKPPEEKKFTGRCRLFVGNLTPDVSEEDFKNMFLAYGDVSEVYVNTGRGFGFIRLVSNKY